MEVNVNSMFFNFVNKMWNGLNGACRRCQEGCGSICDRSIDLISILGKIDFGSPSYICIKICFSKNIFLKVALSQTAPPKMIAMTVGWYQVFCENIDLTLFYNWNLDFSGKPWFPVLLIIESFHRHEHFRGFLYSRKNLGILGKPSRRLHLLNGAILKGK